MARRILQLITELRPGGAERIVCELARGLDRSRFAPQAAALDGRGAYADRIRNAGVEVFDLDARSRWDAGVIWRLRRLLREQSIDLLHTHLVHAGVIGRLAARPLGIPVLGTSHIVERRPVWWHFWLDRWTGRWCERTVCVSEAVRGFQQARTNRPADCFTMIPNGVDLARFADLPTRDEARERLRLPADAFVAGGLGRFDRQKGFDVFLRAAAACRDAGVHFVLAGYGEEEERLRRLAAVLDLAPRLTFAGYQEAAEAFLPALDIAVVPSRWEGFGLVLAEAMACGVPVVASRVDSLPELAADGREAVFVAPEDPEALAGAIQELAGDPARRSALAEAGRVRAQAFGLERMIAAYERCYGEMLAAAQPLP